MKSSIALVALLGASLLVGPLTAQERGSEPSEDRGRTGEATRAGERTPEDPGRYGDRSTTQGGAESATRPTGQGATTDEGRRKRTADAGMRRSRMDTEEFAKKAAAAGAAEVQAGKLGAEKATNPQVRAYAQRMVTDHTKANKELMSAAKAKNIEVRSEPDLTHKAVLEKLELQKADADFDHDLMQQMVRDHEKVIELYENASTCTDVDPEFREMAKEKLPTLKEHLQEAKRLVTQLSETQGAETQ